VSDVRLGLRENLAQFSLLVVVNAFVGAMVGMERAILSPIAEQDFHLAAKTAVLSFIVVFGVTKALTNYLAGRLSDRFGRKHVLVVGWIVAAPVPFMLMWAPTWSWVLAANALLGVSQGLTWSTTVIMKIDLAGEKNRGLAMGLNEFAGYFAVAGSALATGFIAARYGLRPEPFYLGVAFVAAGLFLSTLLVRETRHHAAAESKRYGELSPAAMPTQRDIFWHTTLLDRNLSSVSQAGLVNNLNDGMAWGLFPLFFVAARMNLEQVGTLAAIYPATWGVAQLATGAWSDRVGRKWLIASGMWVQAVGIGVVVLADGFIGFATGAALLGVGTAMVYPTLLAAIGDVAHPSWRASCGCVPALARPRLRGRRAAGRHHGRRIRAAVRHVGRRGADLLVGARRGTSHDGDAAPRTTARRFRSLIHDEDAIHTERRALWHRTQLQRAAARRRAFKAARHGTADIPDGRCDELCQGEPECPAGLLQHRSDAARAGAQWRRNRSVRNLHGRARHRGDRTRRRDETRNARAAHCLDAVGRKDTGVLNHALGRPSLS